MPQVCKVCSSPDRLEIDQLIAEGRPKRFIGKRFGRNQVSVGRHAAGHLMPEAGRAAERDRIAAAGTCAEIARRILRRALEGVDEARGPDAIAKLVQAATNAARLLGQVNGEIRQDQFVVMFQQFGVRDENELKALVQSARQFERLSQEASPEDLLEDTIVLLKAIFVSRPELRPQVIARLSSGAEEVGNGVPEAEAKK